MDDLLQNFSWQDDLVIEPYQAYWEQAHSFGLDKSTDGQALDWSKWLVKMKGHFYTHHSHVIRCSVADAYEDAVEYYARLQRVGHQRSLHRAFLSMLCSLCSRVLACRQSLPEAVCRASTQSILPLLRL